MPCHSELKTACCFSFSEPLRTNRPYIHLLTTQIESRSHSYIHVEKTVMSSKTKKISKVAKRKLAQDKSNCYSENRNKNIRFPRRALLRQFSWRCRSGNAFAHGDVPLMGERIRRDKRMRGDVTVYLDEPSVIETAAISKRAVWRKRGDGRVVNTEARSLNQWCRVKAMELNIMSVLIRYANSIYSAQHCIVICELCGSTIFFYTIS